MPGLSGYTDWKGRELTEEEARERLKGLPICKHCGETINREANPPRPEQQTAEAIRALFGDFTHVESMGGPIARECFIEHHQAFANYVWFERVGEKLVERAYVGDRVSGWEAFGIWPLLRKPV